MDRQFEKGKPKVENKITLGVTVQNEQVATGKNEEISK